MTVQITIQNKHVLIILLFIMAASAIGLVVAYGGNSPSIMGHTWGEIACDSNVCINSSGIHTTGDICTDAGGVGGKCLGKGFTYVGSCSVSAGSSCKCNAGETIMLMTGNSAGSTGSCYVYNQNSATVYAACDSVTVSSSVYACFNGGGNCGDATCAATETAASCPVDCCVPDCTGKSCGSDGCGGFCGSCSGSYSCASNKCCRTVPVSFAMTSPIDYTPPLSASEIITQANYASGTPWSCGPGCALSCPGTLPIIDGGKRVYSNFDSYYADNSGTCSYNLLVCV